MTKPRPLWEMNADCPHSKREHKRTFTEVMLGSFVIAIPLAVLLYMGLKMLVEWLIEIQFDEMMNEVTSNNLALSVFVLAAILVGTVSIVVKGRN